MKRILESIFRNWKFQTAAQAATLSVLIGTFTVLAVALLAQQNLERLLTHWGKEVRVNVYLSDKISATEQTKVEAHINKTNYFNKVEFLSKAEAAKRFQERVGEYLPGLLTDLNDDNPLPASFEMVVESGLHTSTQFDRLVKIAKDIKAMSGVDEVSYGQGWIENYASVLRVFSATSLVFLIVLLCGGLFIIGNSIRSSINQRRDEIEIMELFGATRAMIVTPYIIEGFITATFAAFVALVGTYVLYVWQADLIAGDLAFWNIQTQFEFLSPLRILVVLFAGGTLGALGSYIWVRDVSTGWAAAESGATWSQN